ncbi:methylated-DNA--[protein]-cysteine S-methyltransferase [Clostridium fallax]|uniref:Methylated-DNA--protein-cysteine methyltransferase n=1 Tax=Clostridium fallax TaxID=1533 RepID=A0A1M4Y296_9CLOT|nr:methylated-DNA--[protein]-cysteine S-methyltransferase [Clostridium fallax]SHE99592.1 methylated-DNA-[protein]-cysteine S-methyltransferase [Clostridium fallax]SQB07773.1 methylated-DNA--protein-cysteine methyltransferase [Clostridium fallax]
MEDIFLAYYKSPIGQLEIVTSHKEVISLCFLDEEKIDFNIGYYMPNILKNTYNQLDEYFNGKRKSFDLKLKLEGTEFQKNVWKELQNINYGSTITYKEIAKRIGKEKAYRAVGNANNKNKISIIIPCHRVIGSNNSLKGYEWGLERKRWLIKHEQINI